MLGAVSDISRARRRILSPDPTPLAQVLDGDRLLDDPELAATILALDARAAGEALRTLGAADLRVELQSGFAVVLAPLPEPHAAVEGSCVAALLADLHVYAGTPVAALAAAEVVLARQGGMLRCEDSQVQLWLPLLAGSPA